MGHVGANSGDMNWQHLDQLFEAMGHERSRPLSQFWDFARAGDYLAQNTGLMILQLKPDFETDMLGIGGNLRQARRVSRHLTKAAEHFAGVRGEFRKIPNTILSVYEAEIAAARQQSKSRRTRVDIGKG